MSHIWQINDVIDKIVLKSLGDIPSTRWKLTKFLPHPECLKLCALIVWGKKYVGVLNQINIANCKILPLWKTINAQSSQET